ncbi:MAG: hypothetical protein LBG48_05315 [Rickettsiales bacterium]|jgi:1-aminocyclopropane-1-carboxylate deaminase/D-cysteine desulfhydrase-like pyridoxal-dependent ACC family enzyme|nr:hypothetical protein [Rickettsiales bacterium]
MNKKAIKIDGGETGAKITSADRDLVSENKGHLAKLKVLSDEFPEEAVSANSECGTTSMYSSSINENYVTPEECEKRMNEPNFVSMVREYKEKSKKLPVAGCCILL